VELLQVQYRNFPESEAVTNAINKRYEKLERLCDRIVSCHVIVSAPHRHHHKGKIYHVQIHMHVPLGDVMVCNEREQNPAHEDVYIAVRDAFKAAERKLEDLTRKRRGWAKGAHEVSAPPARIVRLFPVDGYGFIETPDHREIYFHEHAVLNADFAKLNIGDRKKNNDLIFFVFQHICHNMEIIIIPVRS